MGYYSKANGTENIASSTISQILDQVTYPLYAEVQDDKVAIQSIVKRLSMSLSFITFPLLFILLLAAKPMFVILYSEKWLPSVPYFQVLCIGGLAQCLQSVNFQTISAIGKSKTVFIWTMIKRGVGIGFIVGGLALWGMRGILCGAVLNAWFSYFVNMGLVSKYIGYRWYMQLRDLAPTFFAAIVFGIIAYIVSSFFSIGMYAEGLLKVLIFALLYFCWTLVFKPKAFVYTRSVLMPILSKFWTKRNTLFG